MRRKVCAKFEWGRACLKVREVFHDITFFDMEVQIEGKTYKCRGMYDAWEGDSAVRCEGEVPVDDIDIENAALDLLFHII